MKVLVTGAAGRMGAHLTRRLVAEGHVVRAFVLPDDPNNQAIDGPGVEVVPGRLEDVATVEQAVEGVDAIVALAGALTSRLASDRQFYEVNVGGTFNLLMAARRQMPRIQRFIYASSDAVYWSGVATPPLFLPVDETHPRVPGSIYGATKVAAEELALQFRRAYGIPSVVIRPTATADAWELIEPDSVFGRRIFVRGCIRFLSALETRTPEDEDLLETLQAHDDGTEQLFVIVDEAGHAPATNLADARDLAQGIHLALVRPEAVGESFNIGPAAPHGEDELVRHIADRLDLRVVVIPRPHVRPSWYVSSAKARGILGYRPHHSVFSMVDEAVATRRVSESVAHVPVADGAAAG
jgi:nucleoside-diphosphate-sugar epimerase